MELATQQTITRADIDASLTYAQYRDLIDRLLAVNKTTGDNQSEAMLHYAKMNISRMKKWDKIFKLDQTSIDTIKAVTRKQVWIIITEGWCGDAAQNVPVFIKIAAENPVIEVRFLLRDENLQIMDQYLTNGGRSIPKLIALDTDTLQELFVWGPRPAPAQNIFLEARNAGLSYAEPLHAWYAKDKGQHSKQELVALLKAT